MSRRNGQARTGEIKRTSAGWAIRYRDARGVRRQRAGFRTKAEAKQVLDEELRKARLGPLHRPDVTLRELTDAFLEQHDAAPSTLVWIRENMAPALIAFGDDPIGELTVPDIAKWRAKLPAGKRYRSHRALRQVLHAARRWKWIEDNPAADVRNPSPKPGEIHPFESWEQIDAIAAELDDVSGPLVLFLCGAGVRPEEAFGATWADIDLERRVFTVRRGFAKGRLKEYGKTAGSRRAVPLRARAVMALEQLPHGRGILFPASEGGRIDINNWRSRAWTPALAAAGVEHHRIYDLRHTYATWSLAAGVDIFTLARRMGTSVKMIDQTYGHLITGADERERELLDAFDEAQSEAAGEAESEPSEEIVGT
ncbi:MAG: site-specific integrase [Solirubrobacteraceae bacterium]|nr:site-specific integrase [Solirubrobacteraceae bacterium]